MRSTVCALAGRRKSWTRSPLHLHPRALGEERTLRVRGKISRRRPLPTLVLVLVLVLVWTWAQPSAPGPKKRSSIFVNMDTIRTSAPFPEAT